MIYENIEFFNVDHLQEVGAMSGMRLERFPVEFARILGDASNHKGRFRCRRAHGCEMRFVTEADLFDITLMAVEGDMELYFFYGNNLHCKKTLNAGVITVLHIEKPEVYGLIDESKLEKDRFAPNVWRILAGMNGSLFFLELDTFGYSHRPPSQLEKPTYSWLAYGSSITCGSATTTYLSTYLNQGALRLNADVENKGLSGTCRIENFVSDYLSAQNVDILTLELGINMVAVFTPEEFKLRVHYLLKKLQERALASNIFVMDIFPNKGAIFKDKNSNNYKNYPVFKEIIKTETEQMVKGGQSASSFYYIEGSRIVKAMSYLSTDMLHPSDEGHVRMGENLAIEIGKQLFKSETV